MWKAKTYNEVVLCVCLVCWYLIHPQSIRNGAFVHSLFLISVMHLLISPYILTALTNMKTWSHFMLFFLVFSSLLSICHFLLEADSPTCRPSGALPALSGLADGERGVVPKDSLAQARIIPLTRSQSATVTWTETRETDLSLTSLSLPLTGPFLF